MDALELIEVDICNIGIFVMNVAERIYCGGNDHVYATVQERYRYKQAQYIGRHVDCHLLRGIICDSTLNNYS
jgi:hypothetical protein